MAVRKVVEIDQDKCDGCGECVDACHEGAIAIVDGKAVLVSESYCDGLGACLPECPRDAIAVVEREAAPFDAGAVAARQQQKSGPAPAVAPPALGQGAHGGCPGALSRFLGAKPAAARAQPGGAGTASALTNWPVQLHLAPIQAPYFQGARLLVAADCVPFAFADFHGQMLAGRTLLIGCPKLDDTSAYLEKLAAIVRFNDVVAVEVAFMEVPCCGGLVRLVGQALAASGKAIPLELTRIAIGGEILERHERKSA